MGWLTLATLAQFILGTSAVFDKLLLARRFVDPWPYIFWLGILGAFAAVFVPFGVGIPSAAVIGFAFLSGALLLAAFFFQFSALEIGEASGTLPLVGALAPIATFLLAARFLGGPLGGLDAAGFVLLAASGALLVASEKRPIRTRTTAAVGLAALCFGASTVAAKAAYLGTNFLTGFFWIKMGGVLAALALLLLPALRKAILGASAHAAPRSRTLYFANRAYAGLGSLFLGGAVFLAHPALVEATGNLKFVVIAFLAALLLRERFRGWVLAAKVSALALIVAGFSLLGLADYGRGLPPVAADRPIAWGLTYSAKFSRELGLDPRQTLEAILTELRPRKVRLVAYWDDIEREQGRYDFSDLDWQIESARQSGAEVILVAGLKVPRWPECHAPSWARALKTEEREDALRAYLQNLVIRYRNRSGIAMWQIENEPFLAFGVCPDRGRGFLEREIALVKSLDPERPVLVTDGGEFGLWIKASRSGDVFGTTMYRKVYPRFIGPIFGVVEYPISPGFFRVKERIVRAVNRSPRQRIIVSELQGEPWLPTPLGGAPYEAQVAGFSPEYFRDTIEFARAAGFDEYYLWGAEWWYRMKEQHKDSRYWEIAGTLVRSGQ